MASVVLVQNAVASGTGWSNSAPLAATRGATTTPAAHTVSKISKADVAVRATAETSSAVPVHAHAYAANPSDTPSPLRTVSPAASPSPASNAIVVAAATTMNATQTPRPATAMSFPANRPPCDVPAVMT